MRDRRRSRPDHDRETALDRRTALIGGAALGLGGAGPTPPQPLFADGPLARNLVAATFQRARGLHLPADRLEGPRGVDRLTAVRGPALVTLWAEVCAPCLAEASDLARLSTAFEGRVRVQAVLTGSPGTLDYAQARQRLDRVHAEALPTWVEPGGGGRVLEALAASPQVPLGQWPCILLVGKDGAVLGRTFGLRSLDKAASRRVFEDIHKLPSRSISADQLARLQAIQSVWSTPDADAFMTALGAGALDRLAA